MADTNHVLNTRIKLKYDSYENWIAKDPVLLAGEVAIATVATTDKELTGFQNLPNIVIKVGDGSNKYSALKFVSALAADVHGWAKEASKPVYTAQEIDGIKDYVDGVIGNHGEIQDTNTTYTMAPIDGQEHKWGLYSQEKGQTTKALVYTLDLTGIDSRLDDVEAAIGPSGSVSKQITDAVAAIAHTQDTLGETEMYYGYKQVDGIVTMDERTLGIGNVSGLQDALDGKQNNLVFETAYDAATNKVATMANVTGAIGALDKEDAAVAKQFVTAVSETDGIITVTRRGLETTDFGTGDAAILPIGAVIDLEKTLNEKENKLTIADGYNAESNPVATVKTVTTAVADLNGAMHFEGVVEKDPTTFTAEENGAYSAGDVVLFGIYEYVYDGAKWWPLGAEGIYQLKADAKSEHEAMQAEIDALERDKQNVLPFEGTPSESNKVVTKSAMTDAISSAVEALDKADTAVQHEFVTSVSEENGIITVLRAKPVIADIDELPGEIEDIYAEIAKKQDKLDFEGTPSADNKVVTKSAMTTAITDTIGSLDNEDEVVEGEFVTAAVQADGIVTVTHGKVTTDHIKQGTKVLVFDCGTATL